MALRPAGKRSPGRELRNLTGRLILMIVLMFITVKAQSQTFSQVDAETYKFYMEKNWNELIRSGKAALKNDFDFYYLRIRIGIAWYEKKNYKLAQSHFQKALEFNENDPIASEYLYYSYLFAGQKQQAALLNEGFTDSLQEKINAANTKIVEGIAAEYLYNHTFTDDIIDDPGSFDGLPYGIRIITRNYHNLNIGLNHDMHPGTSFTHAYTYLRKSNYYYYDDGIDRYSVDGQEVKQHQYYLSPSFTTRSGLVISPSFHFLNIWYQVPGLSSGGSGPGTGVHIVFSDESVNQLVGGLNLLKYQGAFSFSLGGIYSNLNSKKQFTGNGSITWYPTGNLNMYLGAALYVHNSYMKSAEPELISDLLFGYGIASKVWIEISGTYGNMKNFAQSNGSIVYNGLDWMKYKAMANVTIPFGGRGSMVYVGARFAGYENSYISFVPDPADMQYLINYNSLSFFGGISWKF